MKVFSTFRLSLYSLMAALAALAALPDDTRLTTLYGAAASLAHKQLGMTPSGKDTLVAVHKLLFHQDFNTGFSGPANTAPNVTVGNLRAFLRNLAGRNKATWDVYVESRDRDVNPFLLKVWLNVAGMHKNTLSLTRRNTSSSSSSEDGRNAVSRGGGNSNLIIAAQDAVPLLVLDAGDFQLVNGTALDALHATDQKLNRGNDQCPQSSAEFSNAAAAVRTLILAKFSGGQLSSDQESAWHMLLLALEEALAVVNNFRNAKEDFTVKALTDKSKSVLAYGSFKNLAPAVKSWYSQPSIQSSVSSFFNVDKNKHERNFFWFVHVLWIFGRFHADANDQNAAKMKSLLRVYTYQIKKRPDTSAQDDQSKRRRTDRNKKLCYKCHKAGHVKANCPLG